MSARRPDILLQHIPQCLRERPQWVLWRYVQRQGKQTKIPYDAKTGQEADSTDPSTWASYEAVVAAWRKNQRWSGIGFVFSADDPCCGVDLDDAIDVQTCELKPWAKKFIEDLNSYCEISPSNCGVKLFVFARKPGERCRTKFQDGEVEIYDRGRFFTVTGNRVDKVSGEVEQRQQAVDQLYNEVFGQPDPLIPNVCPGPPRSTSAISTASTTPAAPGTTALTDDQIREKASRSRKSGSKFSDLWTGNWQAHFRSQSEADSSLLFMLAFYTKDAGQLDRLFRQSKLMREKWDEQHGAQTYGRKTIDNALAHVTGQWQPRQKRLKSTAAPSDSDLPGIVVEDIQLNELTQQAITALEVANDPPVVFVRGGCLCRAIPNESGIPRIDRFDKLRMRSRLTQVANFFDSHGVAVNPPIVLAENLVALGSWPFPPLLGVVYSPILRADGTICTAAGYDSASQLMYCPARDLQVPPIPDAPTPTQVNEATGKLRNLLSDFPFADDASRANALAIPFSILMRSVIKGHVPLAVVGAPMQGTGKTLLVTVLGIIANGAVAGESIPSKQNEDEWRKKITSILMSASPFVLLDNIPDNTTIDSAALAAALTIHEWSDRILGRTETARLPSRSVWVATGNNLRISGDMPRRCYTISLDANAERPWERSGFSIKDIERYAQDNRGELLAAAFTIIRAWYVAGCPKAKQPVVLGSFQEWADTVGGVLSFAGVEGFLTNLAQTRTAQDDDTQQWTAFFDSWWKVLGDQAATVDRIHRALLAPVNAIALPEPLLAQKDKGDGSVKRSLGRHLSRLSGRVFAARKLSSPGEDSHTKVRLWRLSPLNNPDNPALLDHNPADNPAQGDE